MKDEVIVSGKGTVCIPEEIRLKHGVKPGQRVRVVSENGEIIIRPARRNVGSFACLKSCPQDFEIPKIRGKFKPFKLD